MFSYSLLYRDIAAGSLISFRASFDIGFIVCRWENGVELSFETTSYLQDEKQNKTKTKYWKQTSCFSFYPQTTLMSKEFSEVVKNKRLKLILRELLYFQ